MTEANQWEIIEGLNAPCADISYEWQSQEDAQLVVTLHFSRVPEGFASDVRLTFPNAMTLLWEDESLGLIPIPDQLPLCSSPSFHDWVFPTLILQNSELATRYADKTFEKDDPRWSDVEHFVMVSMNDLVHVVSLGRPEIIVLAD
ncbi:MAG: hypothetical protein ACRBC3_17710 [Burkholderiaceae bacterium]